MRKFLQRFSLHPLHLALLAVAFTHTGASVRAQDQWLPRTSGTTAHLWGVAHGGSPNSQWIAVGEQGTILTSPDGVMWTRRPSPVPNANLRKVHYANDLFVAVGSTAPLTSSTDAAALILTSSDGITWVLRVTDGDPINDVSYGNGTFVAVDRAGGRWMSPTGVTWSFRPTPGVGEISALTFGSSLFVATGRGAIHSSPDGATFTPRMALGTTFINAVTWGNGRFVAVGDTDSQGAAKSFFSLVSPDGLAWNTSPSISVSATPAGLKTESCFSTACSSPSAAAAEIASRPPPTESLGRLACPGHFRAPPHPLLRLFPPPSPTSSPSLPAPLP